MSDFLRILRKYSSQHNNQILKFCQPLFDHFGAKQFCYYKITHDGYYTSISSHLEFAEYFFSENCHLKCAYLQHPKNFRSGICISRALKDDAFSTIQSNFQTKFNFNIAIGLLEEISDGFQGFTLATNSKNLQIENIIINEMPLFRLFIKRFKENFKPLLSKVNEDMVDIATPIGEAFYNKKSNLVLSNKSREDFLDRLGIQKIPPLTNREKEMVPLIQAGCSAQQVADELKLSRRTIESYTNNLKMKLDCYSKHELIQKLNNFSDLGSL